jgi:hypothetical protein
MKLRASFHGLLPTLAFIAVSGCVTAPPTKQALTQAAMEKVQAEIKRQVGVYLAGSSHNSPGRAEDFWCGSGNLGFDIASVKAELTVTDETIHNAGIKAKLPFNAITVGPSGSLKTDVTNTQVLTYSLWPLDVSQQPDLPTGDIKTAPIAEVLSSLRDALINSSKKTAPGPQACFTDYNPDKPSEAGNTFKLGLSFVNDVTGGFELNVWVLDLTATSESKGTTGNTLTVSFVQHALKEIQTLRDEATQQCKFPDLDKPICEIATHALALITTPASSLDHALTELDASVRMLCTPPKKGDPVPADCKRARALEQLARQAIGRGESFY